MRMLLKLLFQVSIFSTFLNTTAIPEPGYRLWLRYDKISDLTLLENYKTALTGIIYEGNSPTIQNAKKEMINGLSGLLDGNITELTSAKKINSPVILAGKPSDSKIIASLFPGKDFNTIDDEGFIIKTVRYRKNKIIVISGNSDNGILYGSFYFLRLLQTHTNISNLNVIETPKVKIRILNHWDNLNRTVERGYAGLSLWDWNTLPDSLPERYTDYARANASVGINGTVLTNVNANALVLTPEYLRKVAALANIFRSYNIKVYLTARFSAPIEIGKLTTADPLNPDVINWWKEKIKEIYKYIPDFGGFTVKANSEGQPGPQNYNRSHADGANMLADALAPYGGIVMWRAFVYNDKVSEDRAKQAFNEFVPLDGKFRDNVIIQVKNGPIDFQPREPFHPLFGAMPHTNIMPEFQITQEYLGASVHLVYLAPLFEECLKSDTYAKGKGSLVASIIDGTLNDNSLTAIAGVSNIGNVENWTGHPFGQANWYAFGRLAWNPFEKSEIIADEWIKMTFTHNQKCIETIKKIMMDSRENTVNYMTPLGLHHIMYAGHHYGPGPWVSKGRKDWTSVYYHRADTNGIGFDRTTMGSDAVSQYFNPVKEIFNNVETCPENLLLWFHHMPWDYRMKSGRTLWEELCYKYHEGVNSVKQMINEWKSVKECIDNERYEQVVNLMFKQERDAKIWRDACILYFQTFSRCPLPEKLEKPENELDYYINLRYTDIPGIR
ncbi:MAG: alpha-glucuronidase family glycosyl hydrolase [Bacteroidales bacterium]